MWSLHARLLVAASTVLVAFLGLTGFSLDRGFRESLLAAVQDRLQAQIYMLLGVAELGSANRLVLPAVLPEGRFSAPGSGLYAIVMDGTGQRIWRSPSSLGVEIPFQKPPASGQFLFQRLGADPADSFFTLSFSVSWEVNLDTYQRYTFQVAESQQGFSDQVQRFRQNLWGWLAASTLGLLLAQGAILRWSLDPLRQVARQVTAVETGHQTELTGPYPRELRPLTENLNALIHHSHEQLERYRHALANLAHSLKTPLAVLRAGVDGGESEMATTVRQQVERMDRIVEYQLQRAAAAGRIALAAPINVEPVARKVIDALIKVYRDKQLQFQWRLESAAEFFGDEGDLMEMLGNLADNACKWSQSQVVVRAYPAQAGTELVLEVEDDGPGIPAEQREIILARGERADPSVPGHGIGLAVVKGLVEENYQGRFEICAGELGGALVRVRLPIENIGHG